MSLETEEREAYERFSKLEREWCDLYEQAYGMELMRDKVVGEMTMAISYMYKKIDEAHEKMIVASDAWELAKERLNEQKRDH